jgi:hypothetical protein
MVDWKIIAKWMAERDGDERDEAYLLYESDASELAATLDSAGEPGETLTEAERDLLDRILEDFADCGETEVPHEALMDFARRGYLLCEQFTPTNKAHQALASGSAIDGVAPSAHQSFPDQSPTPTPPQPQAPQADQKLLRQAKEALQDLIGWIPNESAMARMGFHTEAPSKAHQKARETLAAIREHLGEQANG